MGENPRERLGLLPGFYEMKAILDRQIMEIEAAFGGAAVGASEGIRVNPGTPAPAPASVVRHSIMPSPAKRRTLSAAARKKIGDAQRQRWAAAKKKMK